MEPLTVQTFCWHLDDGVRLDQFTVHAFGKTFNGKSVAMHVTGFMPSFCVLHPSTVTNTAVYNDLVEMLKEFRLVDWLSINGNFQTAKVYHDHLMTDSVEKLVTKRSAWGFNLEPQRFFQFTFKSSKAYRRVLSLYQDLHQATEKERVQGRMFEFVLDGYNRAGQQPVMGEDGEPTGRTTWNSRNAKEFLTQQAKDMGVSVLVLKFAMRLKKRNLPLELMNTKLFDVIDPMLRFVHLRDLPTAGWISVKNGRDTVERVTTCDIELDVSYENLYPEEMDTLCPEIREMAFDIECYSHNDLFPNANEPRNCVYQIGVTLKRYGQREFHRWLLHCRTPEYLRGSNSGECAPIADIPTCLSSFRPVADCTLCSGEHDIFVMKTHVVACESETSLLMKFHQMVVTEDPDLIYGYNSDVFDWDYIMTRAQVVLKPEELDVFSRMSRIEAHRCVIEESSFSSAAFGDNRYRRVDIPGRLNIDLMIWIQRNIPNDRYPSLSLDTVASKEIGEKKRDVDVKAIFNAFRTGDPQQLRIIGDYCCQDTVLVQKLVNKLDVVTQMFEMAKITDTPPKYLMQKGQQIKCFSQICKEAMNSGFIVPLAKERDLEAGKFKGAIVLEPKVGLYKSPVAVLDFASLYPSIQMAYNVCYTTLVMDASVYRRIKARSMAGQSLHVDGVLYELIEWEEDVFVHRAHPAAEPVVFNSIDEAGALATKKKLMMALADPANESWKLESRAFSFAFAQNQKSLIPELQRKMKTFRKRVKVMMAQIENAQDAESQLRYRVLNGRQLAIKVSMNSLYGFTSAFKLHLRELAACVTAKGRQMIEQTRDFMENGFSAIAQQRNWTARECYTYLLPDGKEVHGEQIDDGQLIFRLRGEPIARHSLECIPSSWRRKFPSAQIDRPWVHRALKVIVVGGDTDSVFCNFPDATLDETISLCHQASTLLTEQVFNRTPIEMEYEKTYLPLVLQKKKNYVGVKYEMDSMRWKLDFKGIAVKRRDSCNFTKTVFWSVIYPSLGLEMRSNGKVERATSFTMEEGPAQAVRTLRVQLERLVAETIEPDDLCIYKSIKSDYKGPECSNCEGTGKLPADATVECNNCCGRGKIVNLPHVQLADRMRKRDPGSAPVSGQRFPYIVIHEDSRAFELGQRTEDPKFARDNNLPPFYLWYLDNQVRKPVTKFLSIVGQAKATELAFSECQLALDLQMRRRRIDLGNVAKMNFFDTSSRKRPVPIVPMKQLKRTKSNKAEGCQSISKFFKKVTV